MANNNNCPLVHLSSRKWVLVQIVSSRHKLCFLSIHSIAYQQMPTYMSAGGLYGSSMPLGMYGTNSNSSMYQSHYGILSDQDKGKGKLKEADFEAAFAQAAASLAPTPAETSRIVEIDDGVADMAKTLQNTTLGGGAGVGGREEFEQ